MTNENTVGLHLLFTAGGVLDCYCHPATVVGCCVRFSFSYFFIDEIIKRADLCLSDTSTGNMSHIPAGRLIGCSNWDVYSCILVKQYWNDCGIRRISDLWMQETNVQRLSTLLQWRQAGIFSNGQINESYGVGGRRTGNMLCVTILFWIKSWFSKNKKQVHTYDLTSGYLL